MLSNARILLVDDQPIFRAGLRVFLERDASLLVYDAASTVEAITIASTQPLDLACVDVLVPEAGGPALVRKLRTLHPRCATLGLSTVDEPLRVAEMLRAGATGYALKSQPLRDLESALSTVTRGVRYLAPQLPIEWIDKLIHDTPDVLQRLTIRERRVFDLLVQGSSNRKIAGILDIACSTVETHRRHIMRKLGAASIVDLVHVALAHDQRGKPRSD